MPFRHAADWLRRTLIPTLAGAMVNLSAVVIITGTLFALWALVQPAPIRSVETVAVDPPSRVIDREAGETLSVTRRVCSSREAEVRVKRLWIDAGNGVTSALDDWAFLEPGCHTRPPIRVTPPTSLNAGLHRYRVSLIWVNQLRTVETHLPDIEVLLIGQPRPSYSRPQNDRF